MRVCKCPQLPLLAHAPGAGEPVLVSAQGTQLDVWRLGVANSRSQQVGPPSTCGWQWYQYLPVHALPWDAAQAHCSSAGQGAKMSTQERCCVPTIPVMSVPGQASSLSGWQWAEGSPVDVAQEPCHLAHIAAKGPGHIAAIAVSARGSTWLLRRADPIARGCSDWPLPRVGYATAAATMPSSFDTCMGSSARTSLAITPDRQMRSSRVWVCSPLQGADGCVLERLALPEKLPAAAGAGAQRRWRSPAAGAAAGAAAGHRHHQ